MRYFRAPLVSGASFAAVLALAMFLGSCSEEPPTTSSVPADIDGNREFEGSLDPGDGSFVLKEIHAQTPDIAPVRVQLIGSNLRVDREQEQISVDVAIRNADQRTLHPKIEVVVSRFRPLSVRPLNFDWTTCPDDLAGIPNDGCLYGYDYSALLGDDNALEPGETSEAKTWVFDVPGLTPFSFAAMAHVSFVPERPRIAGHVFWDANENGHHDPDEPPAGGGAIHVTGPEDYDRTTPVGEGGSYWVPIEMTGLYRVQAIPPPTFASIVPVKYTTPNPLEVIISPDADGNPESFLHADFGIANDLPPRFPPVQFWEWPLDSMPRDPYHLIELRLDGPILTAHVGFSGCDDRQHFQLYTYGGFQESDPVQVQLVLAHDSLGQLCLAVFDKVLQYDLTPIIAAYQSNYFESGRIILNFIDSNGEVHKLLLEF